MDYTTLDNIKAAFDITETAKDALLSQLVTAASRAIDRFCTGAPDSDNYFELATVTDEEALGQVDNRGRLILWPRKPEVVSVSALSYRMSPAQSYIDADLTYVETSGGQVIAWLTLGCRSQFRARVSYTGGFAAETEELPADLIEAATVLAGRFYKEDQAGLGDVIGVADLGVMIYSKALPIRVVEMLRPYKRVVPWR